MMKRNIVVGVLSLIAVSCCWGQGYDPRPKVFVSEEAVVYAKPDKATLSFGVETNDAKANVAKDANNAIVSQALAAIKKVGVKEEDIQTQRLTVEPRWEYNNQRRRQEFVGYQVRNVFVVTLKDLDKVEAVIVAAMDAGVNVMQGVNFETTQLAQYREEAREKALIAAKTKADKMAAVLGQSIKQPIDIRDDSQTGYQPVGYGALRAVALMESDNSTGPTIAVGQIEVRARVSVVFELQSDVCDCSDGDCSCGAQKK
jgi:uncharacterized protein YggE